MIVIGIGIALIAIVIGSYIITRLEDRSSADSWDGYLQSTEGVIGFLGRAARPLASTKPVQRALESTEQYRTMQRKLRLGGAFGGNAEIYFSIQFLAALVALACFATALFLDLGGLFKITFVLLGLVLLYWPLNEVNSKAAKRATEIAFELPDFAEMLIMVLPSMSVPQSLAFTTEHTTGIVAHEMRELVRTLSARVVSEDEAFNITAERLGTDDGRQFVDSLRDAYLEGTRVVDSVINLAESMRKVSFQNQRAVAKRLPLSLTIIFAVHFMPMLFALAFLPVVFGLTNSIN